MLRPGPSSALLALVLVLLAAGAPAVRAQAPVDPCLECGRIYSSDGAGQLHVIDVDAGTSTLVGNSGLTMFDIGIAANGRLVGVDGGGSFWIVESCTAAIEPTGGFGGFVNGLGGDLASIDLFGQGPPLVRIDGSTFAASVVGGSVPGPPPGWCGSSSGDIAMSPEDGLLYSTVFCPACGSDTLIQVDPATGDALAEIGCLREAGTGTPAFGVFGLAFDGRCRLFGAAEGTNELLEIDVTNGEYVRRPIAGGWFGSYGLASLPCPGPPCGAAPTCEPLTQGFWKRQCRGPHPSGEHEQLPSRVPCVAATATFAGVASPEQLCDRLEPNPRNDKCEQAEAQFMALLLNACSGRLSEACCIDSPWSDAATVGEAIAEIDALLSNPARTFLDCVRAQGLADDINTAEGLCGRATAGGALRADVDQQSTPASVDRLSPPIRRLR